MQSHHPYPKPVRIESGCRVSWFYYTSQDEADKASAIATRRGEDMERQGYDFGLMTPGRVEQVGSEWRVVIP